MSALAVGDAAPDFDLAADGELSLIHISEPMRPY